MSFFPDITGKGALGKILKNGGKTPKEKLVGELISGCTLD